MKCNINRNKYNDDNDDVVMKMLMIVKRSGDDFWDFLVDYLD